MTDRAGPVSAPSLGVGLLVTAVGGAAGAVARWSLTVALPVGAGGFPWTILLINVAGSGLLAALPLSSAVAMRPWLGLLLGTGVLGGFTTMSAASTDTFALLDRGDAGLAIAYSGGTLAAALLAVICAQRLGGPVSGSRRRQTAP
jgi:CrcB protein